jgi:glycosyltransferase involved in cell wall biosynthesis
VLIVSRLDPIKRVDLLMDAIDCAPSLRELEFRVLGSGMDEQKLRQRCASHYSNVHIVGFSDRTAEEMARADMLLHLCPEEPFGLAILEAMAARLPILVADTGGAGTIVEPGLSGMHFRANDASSLAEQLQFFKTASAETLNGLVDAATVRLNTQYSAEYGSAQYRQLIEGCWA